ncbi:MAG TPA: PEP-utilizing enzyme, partial [Terriglobia bacterium]|nr:PEP-utilizing enzyme [Terriglobia bacterium]
NWQGIKHSLRLRLLEFARRDPETMSAAELRANLGELRKLFLEGAIQHFIQQPASMVPVADWVRRTRERTSAPTSDIIAVLQNCRFGLADCVHMIDELVGRLRSNARIVDLIRDQKIHPAVRLEMLRRASPEIERHLNAYMDEYGDRIVTGFDIVDSTLRELPGCTLSLILSRLDRPARHDSVAFSQSAEAKLRERLSGSALTEFEDGLAEAKAAYGLHDEDVRTTYLWPLGLMRRFILAAAGRLLSRGALHTREDVFHTTPDELESLLTGASSPCPDEIARRTEEWRAWSEAEPVLTFGERRPSLDDGQLGESCARITSAILFYLAEMEGREKYAIEVSSTHMLQGLAASPGCYEGRARIVRSPADLAKVSVGDVLVAQTTSPAYNVILPAVGAVVTDRGGVLCHAAIIAREFSVPAVVGLNQATLRIPDGAHVLVDGDHGFVAIRS